MAKYGSVRDLEVKVCKKDGSIINVLITATQWQAENGTTYGFQGVLRDVTQQKQAQEKIRAIPAAT